MRLEKADAVIGFDDAGQGPALVLLHAFPLSRVMWAAQSERLGRRRRVISVDARGFGDSSMGAGALTMESIAEDAAAVLDHLSVRRAVLCGCSMGGYAAFAFARLFPERLRGLILVDTKAADDSAEARAGRVALGRRVGVEGPSAAAEAMLPKLLGATSHRTRPELVERVKDWILAAPAQAIVNALAGLGGRPDARPMLGTIAAPCLILRGAEDAISSPSDLEEMQRGIAGSRAITLAEAGHLPSLETPEAFGDAVAAFLDGLPDD